MITTCMQQRKDQNLICVIGYQVHALQCLPCRSIHNVVCAVAGCTAGMWRPSTLTSGRRRHALRFVFVVVPWSLLSLSRAEKRLSAQLATIRNSQETEKITLLGDVFAPRAGVRYRMLRSLGRGLGASSPRPNAVPGTLGTSFRTAARSLRRPRRAGRAPEMTPARPGPRRPGGRERRGRPGEGLAPRRRRS